MYRSVEDVFFRFTDSLEGYVDHMYLDKRGLVTIGRGNLIDPMSAAMSLPFIHVDGTPATPAQIAYEWRSLKLNRHLADQGAAAAKKLTTLHLSGPSIDTLCSKRLHSNDEFFASHFPAYRAWPADAQLGVASMQWAMGAGFFEKTEHSAGFPRFVSACCRLEFLEASQECLMRVTNNPGLIRRNRANVALFIAAHNVMQSGKDYAKLTGWPLPVG